MSNAFLSKRLYRTEDAMLHEYGDLRERLPIAYDNGFGTIGFEEIENLGSSDLAQQYKRLRIKLNQGKKTAGDNAAAGSLATMSYNEVKRTAVEITSMISSVRNWIDYGSKEGKQ